MIVIDLNKENINYINARHSSNTDSNLLPNGPVRMTDASDRDMHGAQVIHQVDYPKKTTPLFK